jgi:peroxiredoxin Q/BCP
METLQNLKLKLADIAPDFKLPTTTGKMFNLSDYAGNRIFLSFFRNGACALCNLRVHELINNHATLTKAGIKVITVFESTVDDMLPYVAQQEPPFLLLADPKGLTYQQYGVETSEEKIGKVMTENLALEKIADAMKKGFALTPQAGSNFHRLPAEFIIGKDFRIEKAHYTNFIIDHLPLAELASS